VGAIQLSRPARRTGECGLATQRLGHRRCGFFGGAPRDRVQRSREGVAKTARPRSNVRFPVLRRQKAPEVLPPPGDGAARKSRTSGWDRCDTGLNPIPLHEPEVVTQSWVATLPIGNSIDTWRLESRQFRGVSLTGAPILASRWVRFREDLTCQGFATCVFTQRYWA